MKKLQYMLLVAGLWMVGTMCVMAQVPAANIRYVRMEKQDGTGGKYTNDGKSWATAKNNIQDAINSLVAAKALPGEVWVGAGTYRPTESTESSGGSTLYMSFKIPAGVTVRGGFPEDGKLKHMTTNTTEGWVIGEDSIVYTGAASDYITNPDQRPMIDYTEVGAFAYFQTVLTGDLSSQTATFEYNNTRNQFNTTFYGNSYHVVTFATNGFHPDGHAKALDTSKGEAAIECMIIEHGNAQFPATDGHPHEAYGGGIYMVKGSHVYNTCVRQCAATRAGGGIYMDGGGMADHVYVSECQALGIGTTYGYGGGICMEDGTYESSDATKGMYPTVLRRSGVTGSVARNGGGLAVYCNNTAYKNRIACSAVLVTNNVAQNEGGGVYLYQGGAISQMTITRNKCFGSGIAVNGMVNGRSGGLYVRDFGNIANSVIWGNECGTRHVQYAGSRSGNEEAKKPIMRCVMLSRADYADWSGVIKYNVNDLSTDNTGAAHLHYPAFKNPTPTAGYISDIYRRSLMPLDNEHPAYSWKVMYSSALANAGVQTIDLDTAGVTPAMNESRDIMGEVFSSHPTLGGYTSVTPMVWPWDNRAEDFTMHLFVDPDADYTENARSIGNSWDNAAHNMSDVLNLMQQTVNALNAAYVAFLNNEPKAENPFATYSTMKLLVHVKEGKITNNGAYSVGHVRNNTLLIPSIPQKIEDKVTIEILGGYPANLTDRDVSVRNPLKYPTIITGDIIDNYAYNVSHLVTFDGAKNVTFDGFQLRNGNASSTKQGNTNKNGAAFTILNSENINVKNCLVAHCSAEIGAAVYADNSTVGFENCIFHNNASTQQIGLAANKPCIIYSGGTSTLTFDHCDVLRNVGYGAWTDLTASQQWTNSIFYGNMNAAVDDTNDTDSDNTHAVMATPAFGGTTANVSGSYCLFDSNSAAFRPLFTNSRFDMSYVFVGGANSNYPRFINPTKNAGVTPSGDITYYGRATSFEPHNTNPMVNAADTKGVAHTSISTSDCWGTDISTVVNRDYGGLPDIGAVENHVAEKNSEGENAYTDGQGFYGRTFHVRDIANLNVGGDGSSWQNAINGNAYYHEASGTFLGADRYKTITWTETVDTYSITYGSLINITTDSASTIQNPKLFLIYSVTAKKYLKITGTTMGLTTNQDEASHFVLSASGEIYDYGTGLYVSTKSASAFTTSGTSKQWNIDKNNGKIRHSSGGKNYYWRVSNASANSVSLSTSDNNNQWQIKRYIRTKTGTKDVPHENDNVTGINGLQYAVNRASTLYNVDKIRREVWVAAGTYSNDADLNEDNCYVIKDHVNVYGAFPKVGNPGKEQRQALLSQYVPNAPEKADLDVADYETILTPKTKKTVESGVTCRVLGQNYVNSPVNNNGYKTANTYDGAEWDGFTLTGGILDSYTLATRHNYHNGRYGGAGACIFENVTLRNMVICNNINFTTNSENSGQNGRMRGGGFFVDGGTIESSYILNNKLWYCTGTPLVRSVAGGEGYGGGGYLFLGTMYNCVIAKNETYNYQGWGAGLFIENANFFNNTIVDNMQYCHASCSRLFGGIGMYQSGTSTLRLYNTILFNNKVTKGSSAAQIKELGMTGGKMWAYNCLIDENLTVANITYTNCTQHTVSTTLFADYDNGDYRLKTNSPAINRGEVNPEIDGELYDLSNFTDMDFTDRVKDCSIDIGAYEFNDAYAISPDTETEAGKAIYYVTPYGRGVASAADPANAACAEKLQKVLDAAGRYKFRNPTKQVVLKVACEASGSQDPSAAYHIPDWIAPLDTLRKNPGDTALYYPAIRDITGNGRYLTGITIKQGSTTLATINGSAIPAPTEASSLNADRVYSVSNVYQLISSTTNVNAGVNLTFDLTFAQSPNSQPLIASVWMDTKGKKTFDEMLVKVGIAGSSTNDLHTFEVTIPTSALSGGTRLRLRLDPSSETISYADAGQKGMVYDIPINVEGGAGTNAFKYYANRTTDPANQDVRIWSILVPRGVEVWGGYTDAFASNTDNGFFLKDGGNVTDRRDVVANPTHFDATYTNKEQHATATTYHIVTFTDRIFDGNGNPYMAVDEDLTINSTYVIGASYDREEDFKHMSDNESVTARAVLDGIFLTGGRADATMASSNDHGQTQSIHQFGGAAVVEPYAHVRNCIVENNSATYGGALALKEKALVSGCLIRNNTADKGAGIYVFENGTKLVESARFGIYTVNTDKGREAKMDANMSRVILSTIVRNEAQQGGGIWFTNSDANVRVNSSVLWRNIAQDQPNIFGAFSPEKPASDASTTIEFYPFAYSAVQNLRLSGTNNIQLEPYNKNGARFSQNGNINLMAADEEHFSDFGYYGLTGLSAMVRTGMSLGEYDVMRSQYGLAAADFMAVDRKISADNAPERTYIEIGARALDKPFVNKQLMLRLYVAQPEDVDADAAQAMALNSGFEPGSDDEYYTQQGSSFAYPFQSLQDALDYIYMMRSIKEHTVGQSYMQAYGANNMPFEIIIAKGTYYPTRDLSGNYGESLANTFAIPEGVSLYGGFSLKQSDGKWYGRYAKKIAEFPEYNPTTFHSKYPYDISYSTTHLDIDDEVTLTIDGKQYTMKQQSLVTMANDREHEDVNKNNIIEPWEFKNQTILSGNSTSADGKGVYHVITVCPDEKVVGILPDVQYSLTSAELAKYPEGYGPKEVGQYIRFNGLTIQGGRAHSYSSELDEMAKYNYYHGGAALLDGNRYNDSYHKNEASRYATVAAYNTAKSASLTEEAWNLLKATDYKHTGYTNAVGYRDIPVSFASCRFYDNEAGYGGAISTNVEIELFQSSFEANLASYFSDQVTNSTGDGKINVTYAGQGGAVFSTYHTTAYNTQFVNNEARDLTHTDMSSGTYKSYRNQSGSNELPGTGGALYSGLKGNLHIFNCNIVRNMANNYPAIFTMNPNYYKEAWNTDAGVESVWYNQIENTVLWGNELNAAAKSNPANASKLFAAQMVVNYGPANRNGAAYDVLGNMPANQAALDDVANDNNLTAKAYSEMTQFCAYELGRGITPKNVNDFRSTSTDPRHHSFYQYSNIDNPQGGKYPYQNSNIAISSDNDDLEGPAFMRPSTHAGVDGYLEAADWAPARLNNLTDNGNTRLEQTINPTTKEASFRVQDGKFVGSGTYYISRYIPDYPNYNNNLPIGDEPYMISQGVGDDQPMYRVSLDPNPTHDQSYIDIGVYEYIHVPLEPETEDEVDILWVSNFEKPENGLPNGSSWLQPTSDLQRAIETLLASRNGHRKEIRICDGTYSPIYTIDGALSFYIDTKYLNDAATGGTGDRATGYGVKSLTIKGGYSREYNNQYDVDLYPVVIKQQTTATPSAKFDHLIFINDATQRYHATGDGAYADANGHGWWNGTEKSAVKTFPIQIDGVTLINDQASDDAKGAAIYYRNQTFNAQSLPTDAATPAHTASSTTDAAITTGVNGDGHHTFVPKTNPHKLILTKTTVLGSGAQAGGDGASAVYVGEAGGNTLIYNSLFHSNYGDPLVASNAKTVNNTFALNGGQVKLSNYTSSESTKDTVSMMFNNVLWRNNNGDSQLTLTGLTASGTDFEHNSTTKNIFAHNAYTGGDTEDIDYTAADDKPVYQHNYNVGLVDLNTDVTYGPNFNDPLNADIMKRDFHISPSMRLLNKGNNTHYGDTALATNDGVYDLAWEVTKRYDLASNNRIAAATIDLGAYEYQYDLNRVLYVDPNKATSGDGLSWEGALGFGTIQNAIDLAGVAHSNLKKPTYVFVKAASSTNMDLHTGEVLTLRDGVQVYGSVMADYGVECPYTLAAQGSTEREFNDEVLEAFVGDVLLYGRYGTISPVEGHTRISGINTNGTAFTVTSTPHRTIIDGFEVMPKDAAAATITAPAIHITPYKSDGQLATGGTKIGLRNIAVHGFNANDCDVAEIDNAILYSTLFHHNTVTGDKAVMRVGKYGYLLNATIEGKTIGANDQAQLHGGAVKQDDMQWKDVSGEDASHVYCSLVNFNYPGYRHEPTIKTLSGYCYALEDENLNYQLTEKSVNIDNYIGVVPTGIPTLLRDYASPNTPTYSADEVTRINEAITASHDAIGDIGSAPLTVSTSKLKSADRDLLGNFRWQPDFDNYSDDRIIDRGAFETWKIMKPYFVVYPNYPYPGTCEYIMKDQALMIDPVDVHGDASAAAHIPGFVLLQEGASLYGNGREMEIAYVGVERTVKNGGDLMVTIPWNQDLIYRGIDPSKDRNAVNGLFIVGYDEANGNALKTINRDRTIPVYKYDATKRADWQYRMKPEDSGCWTPMTEPILPACQGIYTRIVPETPADAPEDLITVRCMGKGKDMHDFIYEELVEPGHKQHTGKAVKLYPHDDITSTAGGGDFTDAKNAGWNFIGYPYLISLYHPYTKAVIDEDDNVNAELNPGVNDQDYGKPGYDEYYSDFLASDNPYAMDRPQTMWLYYDGVVGPDNKVVDGTGGFYSVNSWLKEPSAWHVADNVEPVLYVTEAFFIQSHTLQDSEDLVFYRPTYRSHYGDPASAPERPAYSSYRYYVVDGSENDNDNEKPGVVSPDKVDSLLRGYEKLIRDQHVYIVRRDADGRISEAYDLTGRAVKL